MSHTLSRFVARVVLLLSAGAAGVRSVEAQSPPLAVEHTRASAASTVLESSALARGRYAVVIDLDQNRLFFKQGKVTLWSAPIGTGTGLRLKTENADWDFSTPNGVFHVQYKEEDPVWIAPDWYFIENDLPVPPPDDEARFFPGGLGAAAIYINRDLAIHGTNKPELLGQRVSHGCIRLSNRDALRLFHNVQVGTEVIIVGGEDLEAEPAAAAPDSGASTFDPGASRSPPRDPVLEYWRMLSTEDLLRELATEVWLDAEVSRWPEIARLLLKRGLQEGDEQALRGLLTGILDVPTGLVAREYRTFLADAYARGTLRTLDALSQLTPKIRDRVAEEIVLASINLFPGELDTPTAPWPSRRIPGSLAEVAHANGWEALLRAEASVRDSGGDRHL